MTIDKVYGNNRIGPIDNTRPANRVKSSDNKAETAGSDRVQFSDVLQQVNRAKETGVSAGAGADAERAEKLQSLKEQIAEGTYQPDTRKVAASLLKFIAGNK
jgi:negative regulator of flagellin synthesis FlgM